MNIKLGLTLVIVGAGVAAGGYYFVGHKNVPQPVSQEEQGVKSTGVTEKVETPSTLHERASIGDSSCYGTDGKSVYISANMGDTTFSKAARMEADLASFRVVNETLSQCMAKDSRSVFYGDTKLPIADVGTFEVINAFSKEGETRYMKDKFNLYRFVDEWGTIEIVPNSDVATFRTIPNIRASGNGSPYYALDKNQFYCSGNVNTKIDPATAVVIPIRAADGNVYDDYIQDKNGKHVNCAQQ